MTEFQVPGSLLNHSVCIVIVMGAGERTKKPFKFFNVDYLFKLQSIREKKLARGHQANPRRYGATKTPNAKGPT